MKKGLVIGIIALLFVTSITPFVFGYNQILDVDSDEIASALANLRYLCTTPTGFDVDKYEQYKEMYLRSLENTDDVDYTEQPQYFKPVETEETNPNYSLPLPLTLGLMNSSWPMKCHDQYHTGRSPYGTEGIEYVEQWYYYFDSFSDTSPVIDKDGNIYCGGGYGGLPWYIFSFYQNGTLRWKHRTDGLITHCNPAIAEDGTIYIGSWDCGLYAMSPEGVEKWRFASSAVITSSPAIADDGTIYYGCLGPGDYGRVYALNPNGTAKWEFDTGYYVSSDPAIGEDGTIYIGSSDNRLYAFNPDGTVKWFYETGDWVRCSPSIANDGTIYFCSWDDYTYALNPDGTLNWKTGNAGSDVNPSIGEDGTIYVGSGEHLLAIEPDNGDVLWDLNLGSGIPGSGIGRSSPAICDDGIIYVGIEIGDRERGELVAVNPDGTIRWRQQLSNKWVDSSPAIDKDGTIYVCSASDDWGCLHAIGQLSPDAPSAPTITGTLEGQPDVIYAYTFNSIDPNDDDVYYNIYWGDGEGIGWFGPWESGEDVTVEYIYGWEDTFTIRARAKDVNELWGPWSELEVEMSNPQEPEQIRYFGFIRNLVITESAVSFNMIFGFNSEFPRIIPIINRDVELLNDYQGYLEDRFVWATFYI